MKKTDDLILYSQIRLALLEAEALLVPRPGWTENVLQRCLAPPQSENINNAKTAS